MTDRPRSLFRLLTYISNTRSSDVLTYSRVDSEQTVAIDASDRRGTPGVTVYGITHPRTPYLSQIFCTWGVAYFAEHSSKFHTYSTSRLFEFMRDTNKVVVPNLHPNKWTRS
ncbi:hypothetical protein WOLCODRAFT_164879 [Wolfiporia cocos MD-104 SS10]|uniref:Uncharacterized protein n=1 Tax=Wolfiporia cocos (strain MD-104) TaxID=742152 RepID=A0A2H3K4P8_WOLCO|nr:hypothetical protein WOLCODRAFT_164879 [Wolfiporia cocos MD-104 SS10]